MTRLLFLCLFATSLNFQIAAQQISQRKACERFSRAVVRLEAGGISLGTGFLVSADGIIFTAGHVITDKATGTYFSAIEVVLPDGSHLLAKVVVPMTTDSVGQDYAILKVDGKSGLPILPIGSDTEVAPGSDIIIIGYPFSAITLQDQRNFSKFCLSGMVAGSDLVTVPVDGTNRVKGREFPINVNVKVEVIYFQGPSVKGLSGSPIISRDTGKVVGILTTRLTGISRALAGQRDALSGSVSDMISGGFSLTTTLRELTDVLDTQLANGLGAATGIDDPSHAFSAAQKLTYMPNKSEVAGIVGQSRCCDKEFGGPAVVILRAKMPDTRACDSGIVPGRSLLWPRIPFPPPN